MRMILIRIQLTRRVSILHAPCQVVNTPTASVGIRQRGMILARPSAVRLNENDYHSHLGFATTMRDCRQAVPNTHDASVVIR